MTPIAQAVREISAHPTPVVFLDSCILLDVVRAPLRNTPEEVLAARTLLTAAIAVPKSVCLAIVFPTLTEWADHIDEAVKDCEIAVGSANAVGTVCGYLAFVAIPPLPTSARGLPNLLKQLSQNILSSAVCLEHHPAALARAIDRVVAGVLPARKGGRGAKDAVILEHALETTRQLRNAGVAVPCLFVSSNTSDFAASKTAHLHPLLAPDFASPTNSTYAASLHQAVATLLAMGWVP